eukprot:CAMPEP_0182852156 /NCGR_PEP_ID=MMETSP0034_2-20130328/14_1 /TAXON_ID=156128 /ORGANISM="Nephroselmis pyriformis, Strain CCMP717" /LENGTH=32 /DNA_ID= /DNA_START= /DNA_END= /DNA_ORIENTATION=
MLSSTIRTRALGLPSPAPASPAAAADPASAAA